MNTLLSRYQRAKQEAASLEQVRSQLPHWQATEQAWKRVQEAAPIVLASIERAIAEQRPFTCEMTATPLDPLIVALNGYTFHSSSLQAHPRNYSGEQQGAHAS